MGLFTQQPRNRFNREHTKHNENNRNTSILLTADVPGLLALYKRLEVLFLTSVSCISLLVCHFKHRNLLVLFKQTITHFYTVI